MEFILVIAGFISLYFIVSALFRWWRAGDRAIHFILLPIVALAIGLIFPPVLIILVPLVIYLLVWANGEGKRKGSEFKAELDEMAERVLAEAYATH